MFERMNDFDVCGQQMAISLLQKHFCPLHPNITNEAKRIRKNEGREEMDKEGLHLFKFKNF